MSGIMQQQHAPVARNRHAREQGRNVGGLTPAAVQDESALTEQRDADAGAQTAAEQRGIYLGVGFQPVQVPNRRGDGERELGA